MEISYSFHLSAKKHAIININKLKQCSKHNLRKYQSEEYEKEQITTLVGSDNILNDVKKIYKKEFREALEEYNKGKREDRKIKDYMQHVSDSRTDLASEIIIQIGDKEFWANKTEEEKRKMEPIYKKQLEKLNEICPEFKIANCTIHYDEYSVHAHLVGVPIAEGYTKGLSKQVAKTKVFTAERLSEIQKAMHDYTNEQIKECEIFQNMQIKKKEKGRNKDIPKKSLDEYYRLVRENEEMKEEINKLTDYVDRLKAKIKYIQEWLKAEKQIDDDLEIEYKRKREFEIER